MKTVTVDQLMRPPRMLSDIDVDGGVICATCKTGCCSSCADAVGYIAEKNAPPDLYEEIRRYKAREYDESIVPVDAKELIASFKGHGYGTFDPKRGFLTDTGCSLPREKRSRTCRSYRCDKVEEGLRAQTALAGMQGLRLDGTRRITGGFHKPPYAKKGRRHERNTEDDG